LELARVLERVRAGLVMNEPDHAKRVVLAPEGQDEHGAIAQLDDPPVSREGPIELLGRIGHAAWKLARVGPQAW
jgi:hypothetical protein